MQKDLLKEIEEMRRSLNSLISANSLLMAEEAKLNQRLDFLISRITSEHTPHLLIKRRSIKNY
jgi:regulator of replication initiation timing